MKKLLLFMAVVLLGLGMTGCDKLETDYMYSIHRGFGSSYTGVSQEVVDQKSKEFWVYVNSLEIPTDILQIKANSRAAANEQAIAWFNSHINKVSSDKVNSFSPCNFYLSYTLLHLPENSDTFVALGESKEFGDLSLNGKKE